jgi:hypothetical protein
VHTPQGRAPAAAVSSGTGGTGGGPRDDETERIAQAACARVHRCGGTGPLGAFSSREDCVEYLIQSGLDPLGTGACRDDIEEGRLGACLAALREQGCDEAGTPEACLPSTLCPRSRR